MVFDMKHGLDMKRLRENRLYGQIIDFRANVSYPNRILRKTVRASLFSFKSRREKRKRESFRLMEGPLTQHCKFMSYRHNSILSDDNLAEQKKVLHDSEAKLISRVNNPPQSESEIEVSLVKRDLA